MTRRKRFWTLLFSTIAVMATILLSAGLSELELLPGQPFSIAREIPMLSDGGGLPLGEDFFGILLRAFFIFVGLLLPFAIIYFIVSPEARKRVLRDFVFLLPILALYYLFLNERYAFRGQGVRLPDELSLDLFPSGSTVEFVADPPQWFVFVASLGLAALLVGVVWFVWRRTRRPANPLERLAQEAQDALEALQARADLKDTVMRCYYEMTRALSEQGGIRRERAMTPREFEEHLEEAGFPGEHVRRLTRLFEEVRYGARVPGEDEERQAIACLTAIVKACGSSPLG